MKKPDPKVTEQLWKNVETEFEPVIAAVLSKGGSVENKRKLLREALSTAYKGGVERGYDLGFHVFGDHSDGGDDGEEVSDATD